jgi:hypothetical protein
VAVDGDQSLAEHMYLASSRFGQSAVEGYENSDWMIFALHAGTALELLAKAYLAAIHPSLVVEGIDSLMYAIQVPGHSVMPLHAIRTIRTSEAITRAGRVLPIITNLTRGDLGVLIDVRNGAAHLGQIDQVTARRALTPFLRACDELLRGSKRPPGQYWGEDYRRVDRYLSESADSARDQAKTRISDAKKAFASRTRDLDSIGVQRLVESIYPSYDTRGYDHQLHDCPACASQALISGSFDFEWTVDDDLMDPEV